MNSNEPLWKILEEDYNYHKPWEKFWSFDEGVRRDWASELRLITKWIREKHIRSQGIIAVGAREVARQLEEEALLAESNENQD